MQAEHKIQSPENMNLNKTMSGYFRSMHGIFKVCFLLVCLLMIAAGHNTAAGTEGNNRSSRVLIVSNKAKTNDPVIIKVAQELKNEGKYVKIAYGASLKGMKANSYGAIIIVNFIEDKNKDRSVRVFADESVQKRIVLLNAIGDYLSQDKGQKDSTTAKSDKIAAEIVEKTKTVLSYQ